MPRSVRVGSATIVPVTSPPRAEVFEQLRRVIEEEVGAQLGVERPIEALPPLIADAVLDYFDVVLKPGATLRDTQ